MLRLIKIFALAISLSFAVSCNDIDPLFTNSWESYRASAASRADASQGRKVVILYSLGFNSLSDYLKEDIDDLCEGDIPEQSSPKDILLVYSHLALKGSDGTLNYRLKNTPVLFRVYRNMAGEVIRDTLRVYPENTQSASAEELANVLGYIKDCYPAGSYGLIMSSHATGWVPSGYYSNPYAFDKMAKSYRQASFIPSMNEAVPLMEPADDPYAHLVKSFGQCNSVESTSTVTYEIDIRDMTRAIPMHLDYIIFDACLMGGIELAYEMKDVCDKIFFSQTEVLADGIGYKQLCSQLFDREGPGLEDISDDYFQNYNQQSGVYRSATVTLVDCRKLEPVAEACRPVFEKYRSRIKTLNYNAVQKFYRGTITHWYYDLRDIMKNAGATDEELAQVDRAIDDCILYRASTPEFMGSFRINSSCGFSCYLPSHGSRFLDLYYTSLKWNQASGLVKVD